MIKSIIRELVPDVVRLERRIDEASTGDELIEMIKHFNQTSIRNFWDCFEIEANLTSRGVETKAKPKYWAATVLSSIND